MKRTENSKKLDFEIPSGPAELFSSWMRFKTSKSIQKFTKAARLTPMVLFNCFISGIFGGDRACSNNWNGWFQDLNFEFVPIAPLIPNSLPLKRFLKAMAPRHGDLWPAVLERILNGFAPIKRVDGVPPTIDSLYISNFDEWSVHLNSAQPLTASSTLPLMVRDIAFYLNYSRSRLIHLFPNLSTLAMDLTDVYNFSCASSSVQEISDRLLIEGEYVHANGVYFELVGAGIKPLRRHRFSRLEAEQHFGLSTCT